MAESTTTPIVINSPSSALAKPQVLISEIVSDLVRCRELTWVLFQRDLKAQFRQSYLGYVWLFLPPVLTTAVWLFLNQQQVISVADTDIPYPVFVITGSVIWQTFVRLLQSPVTAFNAGKPVFMKLKVPPEAFIAAGSARAIFEFLLYCLVLVPTFLFFSITPTWTIVLVPFVILTLLAFGTAIGLLLVPLGSLYSDIQQAIPISMGFLMYLAPVVYPPPESGISSQLIHLNPMTPVLMSVRDLLTTGSLTYFWPTMALLPVSLVLIVVSMLGLRVAMPHMIARAGM